MGQGVVWGWEIRTLRVLHVFSKLTSKQLGYIRDEYWNKNSVKLLTEDQLRGDLPVNLLGNVRFMRLLTINQLKKIKPELIKNMSVDFLTLDVVLNLDDEQFEQVPLEILKQLFDKIYDANKHYTDVSGITICSTLTQKQIEFCKRLAKILKADSSEDIDFLHKVISLDQESTIYLSPLVLSSLFSKRDERNCLLHVPTRYMIRQMKIEQLIELAKIMSSDEFNNIVLYSVSSKMYRDLLEMIQSNNVQFKVVPASTLSIKSPVDGLGSALGPAESDADPEILGDFNDETPVQLEADNMLYEVYNLPSPQHSSPVA